MGIGLTVFLSLYVLQLAIAENIPESNSLPIIGEGHAILYSSIVGRGNDISHDPQARFQVIVSDT